MCDDAFRQTQASNLYAPHVAPINEPVDSLRGERGWAPHIAPIHGGIDARLMWILRDAGPHTQDPDRESHGYLSVENDDPSAERLCDLLDLAGIDVGVTLPWNAYPWYINRAPSVAELRAGTEPLRQLLGLIPKLDVVVLMGTHAARSWQLLTRGPGELARSHVVLQTRHSGKQAFIGSADQRANWRTAQEQVFRQAGLLLRGRSPDGERHDSSTTRPRNHFP